MKIIKLVGKNEVINHLGDLIIEGDVEENATLNIEEGSLIILGDVKDGAKITIKQSRMTTSFIADRTEPPHDRKLLCLEGVGSVLLCSKESIWGKAQIHDRVFTTDAIDEYEAEYDLASCRRLEEGSGHVFADSCYLIRRPYPAENTASDLVERLIAPIPFPRSVHPTLATATIDGNTYQGKEIVIYKDGVFVDNKKVATTIPLISRDAKLIVQGNISHADIKVPADMDIKVKGTLAESRIEGGKLIKESSLTSALGLFRASKSSNINANIAKTTTEFHP